MDLSEVAHALILGRNWAPVLRCHGSTPDERDRTLEAHTRQPTAEDVEDLDVIEASEVVLGWDRIRPGGILVKFHRAHDGDGGVGLADREQGADDWLFNAEAQHDLSSRREGERLGALRSGAAGPVGTQVLLIQRLTLRLDE